MNGGKPSCHRTSQATQHHILNNDPVTHQRSSADRASPGLSNSLIPQPAQPIIANTLPWGNGGFCEGTRALLVSVKMRVQGDLLTSEAKIWEARETSPLCPVEDHSQDKKRKSIVLSWGNDLKAAEQTQGNYRSDSTWARRTSQLEVRRMANIVRRGWLFWGVGTVTLH